MMILCNLYKVLIMSFRSLNEGNSPFLFTEVP